MQVEAPIVAVVVYPDRARITRRGTVSLEVGTHELAVHDLTLLLDPESVRAGGEGTASVRLLGVDVRQAYYTETPSVPAAELRRQLEGKLDADQALQDEVASLDQQLAMLSGLAEHAGKSLTWGIARGQASVEDGGALLSFMGTQHELCTKRKRAIVAERREVAAEIEVLRQELARIEGSRPRERYTAVVGVEAISAGEFALELEYTTRRGASWRPLYDLRLLEEGDQPQAEITYLAQVQQSTGEDWLDVDLTLSTARPAVSADLPELSPWYVRVYEPPRPVPTAARQRSAAPQVERFFRTAGAVADAAEEQPLAVVPAAAQVQEAEIDAIGSAVTFHIPRRADVPADNTPQKTTVCVLRLKPELDFYTVPKLVDEVYRRAKVHNDSEVTFLPGPVSLFHGSEFVGRATLDKVAPRETFETTMGIDDRIKVERELVLKEVAKQFIGDRRVLRYGYEVKVENLLPRAAKVVVSDQLPVPDHEDVKIKAEVLDPEPERQSEQGELTWKLSLDPGAKRTLRFDFVVTAPRGVRLVGLPEY